MAFVSLFLGALALTACSGSSTPAATVKTTSAEVSSMPRHRTYMHATAEFTPEGWGTPEGRPEIVDAIWSDVDEEMTKRGYELAPDADLVVRVSGGRRTYDKEPRGAAAAAGATATEGVEGALVVDIFERTTGKQLYHSFAHTPLPNEKAEPAQIKKSVTKMFKDVPARGAGP